MQHYILETRIVNYSDVRTSTLTHPPQWKTNGSQKIWFCGETKGKNVKVVSRGSWVWWRACTYVYLILWCLVLRIWWGEFLHLWILMVIPVLLTQGKKNYRYQMCMKVVVGIKVSFIDDMW